MNVVIKPTKKEHINLGKWVAQIENLPQARCYGSSLEESFGKIVLTFGKENGIKFKIVDGNIFGT